MQYTFEWDVHKAKSNVKKHRVHFEQAAEVFLDALQLSIMDIEHSEIEERWVTMGKTKSGKLLVVSHTFQEHKEDATIRIISAREATKHEQRQYEES